MRRFFVLGLSALCAAAFGPGIMLRADDDAADPSTAKAEAPSELDLEAVLAQARAGATGGGPSAPEKKYRDFAEVTKGAKKYEGLFTLHEKDDHLYAEIKPFQFDQPFLLPITLARGLTRVGDAVTSDDEMVLVFHKVGDKVQLVRRNVHFKAPAGSPLEKAVKQNYTDSILLALPIVSVNPANGMSTVIDLSDILLSDFAQLGLGSFDRNRSGYSKIKAFPNNLEIQVEATYAGRNLRGDAVADPRGLTVVIHYSLIKMPDGGYRPRMADDRVGHFLSAVRDYGKSEEETTFVRMVNRWRLEKADPKAKLSPPKKQIVFYVEDNVPYEYRPYVEAGIREWNKAFEKVGFLEAIAVRWQQPGEEFDPEDTNYCTFRWITTGRTFARSNLRANPLTGEMIDGDVIFDAGWIQAWKDQYALLTGIPNPKAQGDEPEDYRPVAVGEIISPILAAKQGFGLPPALQARLARGAGEVGLAAVPAEWSPIDLHLAHRFAASHATCNYAAGMGSEIGLALLALADDPKEGDKKDEKKEGDKPGDEKKEPEKKPEPKLPEELIGQGIKEVTMHEVGHSLGLRHNFRASAMLDADQLNDTSITRSKGNTGSVMDYTPINLAPKGQPQGDYFSTTIGPYDYWAIEYAYKPISGNEDEELRKLAARAPEADLAYATDEDVYSNSDPLVNRYDLGSDVCRFAKDRMALTRELMKDLDAKAVRDGDSWARNRRAFSYLISQYGNAATLISAYVGGQSVTRHHKGDKDASDPIVPIPGEKQREALELIVSEVLGDAAFSFSPATLRRLGVEKWYHWGSEGGFGASIDYSLLDRVLQIQKIALSHLLSADVLARLQNQQLLADPDTKPLEIAEVFRALTDGVWSELAGPAPDAEPKAVAVSTIRRNLQREHLKRLAAMTLGEGGVNLNDSFAFLYISDAGSVPPDARALARMHLKEIQAKISKVLDSEDRKIDDTTRAHLEECRDRIGKVLEAGLKANGF